MVVATWGLVDEGADLDRTNITLVAMTKLASPRRLAFRGTLEVFAWGFPHSLVRPDELPERVLALWQSRARLEEFEWGHVL